MAALLECQRWRACGDLRCAGSKPFGIRRLRSSVAWMSFATSPETLLVSNAQFSKRKCRGEVAASVHFGVRVVCHADPC
eukprot:scaffold245_cov256-Pinguiococcus_pyrenoidosus.AAC.49